MASSAPSCISTNANPRLRPVSRSLTIWAPSTVPYWENAATRSSLVVWNEMLPTYNFFAINSFTLGPLARKNCAELPRERQGRTSGCDRSRERSGNAAPLLLQLHRLDCLGGCE